MLQAWVLFLVAQQLYIPLSVWIAELRSAIP